MINYQFVWLYRMLMSYVSRLDVERALSELESGDAQFREFLMVIASGGSDPFPAIRELRGRFRPELEIVHVELSMAKLDHSDPGSLSVHGALAALALALGSDFQVACMRPEAMRRLLLAAQRGGETALRLLAAGLAVAMGGEQGPEPGSDYGRLYKCVADRCGEGPGSPWPPVELLFSWLAVMSQLNEPSVLEFAMCVKTVTERFVGDPEIAGWHALLGSG